MNIIIKSFPVLLLMILGPAGTLAQRSIFVSPESKQTQDGSQSHPFSKLEDAAAQAMPGDTIYLLPGRYNGTQQLRHIKGQPNQPIVITAFDKKAIPVIDGLSEPSNDALHPGLLLDSCRWISISAIKF